MTPSSLRERRRDRRVAFKALRKALKASPHQRVGQMIFNAVQGDPFYIEDRDLAARLDAYREARR